MPRKDVIVVFMKEPVPGSVKTRLAADLGSAAAAEAYEALAAWTFAYLPVGEAEIWVAYAPVGKEVRIAEWLRGNIPSFHWSRLIPQAEGDLGLRMWTAVEEALVVEGAASVTLVGTDCPRVRPWHFRQAWRHLAHGADVVFGPALDGGYYLQSLKVVRRELFFGIPWSTAGTLAACLERAEFLGLRCAQLESLGDVDTLTDWENWQREIND